MKGLKPVLHLFLGVKANRRDILEQGSCIFANHSGPGWGAFRLYARCQEAPHCQKKCADSAPSKEPANLTSRVRENAHKKPTHVKKKIVGSLDPSQASHVYPLSLFIHHQSSFYIEPHPCLLLEPPIIYPGHLSISPSHFFCNRSNFPLQKFASFTHSFRLALMVSSSVCTPSSLNSTCVKIPSDSFLLS